MRIAVLVAVSLLIAGCSHGAGEHAGHSSSGTATSATSSANPSSGNPQPAAGPAAGAPISAVIAWIEAGHPADPVRYHNAARDGVTTELGSDVAFSVPGGAVACTTDVKHTGGALACLVKLTNPPPAPATAYGEWKAGWVDFDGTNLQVGSTHPDPGPFILGNGPELANGDSLSFGDYRCRSEQNTVVCASYAHQSAARLSPAGVEPFGCLRSVPPPDGVGTALRC
ncbi:hypothetical protein [Mycobacterium angelicum]|uniref:LppI n=1 Tax=Mycobacterium angelicum TaxID=470074 RepID=A0A1W9ZVD2_MYCAN|nr:hypothetical protein [Mycobacterium angelicum]MCV7200159.1 hypothetical protein [Mycobacterium angelicum]ORA21742.1 hypothetical protein BST12_11845 [Mycobacterium angelicum]